MRQADRLERGPPQGKGPSRHLLQGDEVRLPRGERERLLGQSRGPAGDVPGDDPSTLPYPRAADGRRSGLQRRGHPRGWRATQRSRRRPRVLRALRALFTPLLPDDYLELINPLWSRAAALALRRAGKGRVVTQRRCFGDGDPVFERYHDEEWGFPVLDEGGLFERLSLEAFQSGLSWRTILTNATRSDLRSRALTPMPSRRFGDAEIEGLLANADIVRNRAKIEATLANARATVALRAGGEPLDALIRAHASAPRDRPPAAWSEVPSTTPESVALARELKRRGFRFVGPTTLYALMQACGLVNDHLAGCPARPTIERAREAAGLVVAFGAGATARGVASRP